MGKAKIAVHLLNEVPGREIEGESGLTYPQKQLNLALEHAESQIVWVPKKTDIEAVEDEDHKNFLKRIESHPRKAAEFDFVRSQTTELTQVILEKIDQLKSRAAPAPSGAAPSVLIDTHSKDHLHAIALNNFLVGKQIMPFINPLVDNPQENMDKFEEHLQQVSRLIFIYGDVAKDWVMERINVVLELIIVKKYLVDVLGIYLAPPHKNPADIQLKQRFIHVHLINNSDRDALDPVTLTPLFENPGKGGAP